MKGHRGMVWLKWRLRGLDTGRPKGGRPGRRSSCRAITDLLLGRTLPSAVAGRGATNYEINELDEACGGEQPCGRSRSSQGWAQRAAKPVSQCSLVSPPWR